ncbi:MAG: ABC transporter ATP-binding protein, partial [Chloroflexota bacterium]
WQRIALARAMMTRLGSGADILILDEPTANLDAETEHALFARYAHSSRVLARTTGTITVLVSHRFSTVRMADLIVVLDHGRIAERGSHAALMAADGLYAELYRLQARAYLTERRAGDGLV